MARDLAIVLNNGSINSLVTTALAAQKFRPIMLYAQAVANPVSNGKAAYDMQVQHFRPYREHTLAMPYLTTLRERSTSPAPPTDPRMPAPLGPHLTELLPFVSAAIGFAAHYEAAAIYIGLRVGSNNDQLAQASEYVQIFNELIQHPCSHGDVELVTPILELEPWQVVDVGFQVAAPFERTWTCHDEAVEPCWACAKCRQRESAFQQAGKADPLRAVKNVK